jgi:hypothetical protein
MRARELIAKSGALYGPDTLRVIITAFDCAWAEIAHRFEPNSDAAQSYRLKLAEAVLAEADQDSCAVNVLKDAPLRRLQRQHH